MAATILTIAAAEVRFGAVPTPPAVIDPTALTDFACQVTRAEITATSNTTTTSVNATFCGPGSESTVPVASSFSLELEYYQDWTLSATTSLSAYMFKNDAKKIAFALFLDGADDPSATGICTAVAGAFAGTAAEPLTATGSLAIDGYPDITDSAGASLRPVTFSATTNEPAAEFETAAA